MQEQPHIAVICIGSSSIHQWRMCLVVASWTRPPLCCAVAVAQLPRQALQDIPDGYRSCCLSGACALHLQESLSEPGSTTGGPAASHQVGCKLHGNECHA
jgi:hypothetical protein